MKQAHLLRRCTALALSVFLLLPPGARAEKKAAFEDVRGTEKSEYRFGDYTRGLLYWILYLPAQALDASLAGTAYASAKLSDKDFVEKVKDILYIYDRKLLMFPIYSFTSGFRPEYGGGLYYKDGGLKGLFRGTVYDSHYWSLSVKPSYTKNLERGIWKSHVLAAAETKDDRRYYGLGADPHNDTRNTFIGTNDYGIYTERRRKIQWGTGFYTPDENYGLNYLGYYQRRSFLNHGRGTNDVREVFDLSTIPGFDHPVSQFYNELSFEVDTRKKKKILAPGFHGESYGGFSNGTGSNHSDFFRTGFDLAGFIPTIKPDRLIVPRVVFDLVDPLDHEAIPFSEYARQSTFRGISSHDLLRSERVSMVPSLEYQWPLSHMLSGHVFYDYLVVGPTAGGLRWHESSWCTGVGLDFHLFDREFARIELAGGSEGFQATLKIGQPLRSNHRADW